MIFEILVLVKNELHEEVITDRFMLVDVADRVGKHGSDW